MSATTIPDEDLIAAADAVTVWVANEEAPRDVWSLAEAVAWCIRHPGRAKLTLFRPPDKHTPAAWVGPDQIERLAFALTREAAAGAG